MITIVIQIRLQQLKERAIIQAGINFSWFDIEVLEEIAL
jgi:hypothetical protein